MFLEPLETRRRLGRQARFFDNGAADEGAYFVIVAPDPKAMADLPEPAIPHTLEGRWFDIGYRVASLQREARARYWAADAVPTIFVDFGCGNLAGLIGAPYRLAEGTIWFDVEPIVHDWRLRGNFTLNRANPLYQAIRDTTRLLAEESEGQYFVGVTDIGSNLDVLGSLRNRQSLLMDLIARPGPVKAALAEIDRLWLEFFEENLSWIGAHLAGLSSFSPLVYQGRWYKLMSESSVMISASMFEEFIIPCLAWQIERLDRAIFNLDGLGQRHLLDPVLSLEGLLAVEWNPVPGYDARHGDYRKDYTSRASLEVGRRIQAHGKKLILTKVKPDQVETIMSGLNRNGLLLAVDCQHPSQADDLAEQVRRWQE